MNIYYLNNSCRSIPFFKQISSTASDAVVTTTGAQKSPSQFFIIDLLDISYQMTITIER